MFNPMLDIIKNHLPIKDDTHLIYPVKGDFDAYINHHVAFLERELKEAGYESVSFYNNQHRKTHGYTIKGSAKDDFHLEIVHIHYHITRRFVEVDWQWWGKGSEYKEAAISLQCRETRELTS